MMLRLGFSLTLVLGACACSSSEGSSSGGADAASDTASADTGAADAGAPEVASETASTTCVVKRTAKTADCAEDCDARLFLPGGDAFCTLMCAKDGDCTKYGADLGCSSGTGTCMPRCTTDASCTGAGFKRCDADAGACDTI